MGLSRDKIEVHNNPHKSHKWDKKQMNRYIRRQPISTDDIGKKIGRKPTKGWEL